MKANLYKKQIDETTLSQERCAVVLGPQVNEYQARLKNRLPEVLAIHNGRQDLKSSSKT